MSERRYSDEEVRRIFDTAAEARGLARESDGGGGGGGGLTLPELQEIGREVGLSPERIAQAAGSLQTAPAKLPSRKLLGMPLSVGHVVELSRAPTDAEWGVLVAEMRQVFGARGHMEASGGFREWGNGNLHALVEPTAEGARLRFGTLKGSARPLTLTGLAFAAFALVTFVLRMLVPDAFVSLPVVLWGVGGTIMAGTSLLRLPGWAREREEQFRYLGERAQALIGTGASARPEPGRGGAAGGE